MTPSQLNKRLESLDKKSSKIIEEFIRAGRGNEKPNEIWHMNDTLAQKYKAHRYDVNEIEDEITRRFGPGMRRAPVRRSKSIRGKNPVGPTQSEVDKAANLFRDFSGEYPEGLQSVKLPVPKTGLVIGELDAVDYTTVRDGKTERYRHSFKKSSRPHLAASHDGKSLHVLGGEYEFTERGIEDK